MVVVQKSDDTKNAELVRAAEQQVTDLYNRAGKLTQFVKREGLHAPATQYVLREVIQMAKGLEVFLAEPSTENDEARSK